MNAIMVVAKDKLLKGSSGSWEEVDKGWMEEYFDKSIDKVGDKISNRITEYGSYLLSDALSILEFGAITFGFYHTIIVMFIGNKSLNGKAKPMDRVMLSYFTFFILRILNTVLKVRSGIIGN